MRDAMFETVRRGECRVKIIAGGVRTPTVEPITTGGVGATPPTPTERRAGEKSRKGTTC
jgi:hypothetical protein